MKWEWVYALSDNTLHASPAAGSVYRGTIATDPWESVGIGSGWQHIAADGDQRIVVANGTALTGSTDGGGSWTTLTAAPSNVEGLYKIRGGQLLAILADGSLMLFDDELGHSNKVPGGTAPTTTAYNGIAGDGSATIVAVADSPMVFARSTDSGATWSSWSSGGTCDPAGVVYGNSQFVALGADGNTLYSATGASWSAVGDNTDLTESDAVAKPEILAGFGLSDQTVLIATYDHATPVNPTAGYVMYRLPGTTLEYWTDTQAQPFRRVYREDVYHLELTTPESTNRVALFAYLTATDGVLTQKNTVLSPEFGMLWFGHFASWYQCGGTEEDIYGNMVDEGLIHTPFLRKVPSAVKALAVAKRDVMPVSMIKLFGRYSDFF